MADKGEVIVSKEDKEAIISKCNEIREILKKYPDSDGYTYWMTRIARAKSSAYKLEMWAKELDTE